ncbi:hypothetical protein [Niallia sp. 03133]|uniref:hypothetical protein n=1 Tax=Niallia sp. 03133 TaxID=3458060 RepID=UPI004043F227
MKVKLQLVIICSIFTISMIGIGGYANNLIHSSLKQSETLKNTKEMQRLATYIQYRITGISNDERAFLLT